MPSRSGHRALLRAHNLLCSQLSNPHPLPDVASSASCLGRPCLVIGTRSFSTSPGSPLQLILQRLCAQTSGLAYGPTHGSQGPLLPLFLSNDKPSSLHQLNQGWAGSLQYVRHAHMHLAPRPMLAQDADTVYLDGLLRSSAGPLQPRYFYRYRTVRNGLEVTATPKPPRPSKYVHDNSPTLIPRDFELATLAPTLRALGSLNAVTPGLLDAATRQLLASRQDSTAPAGIALPADAGVHGSALDDGAPGGRSARRGGKPAALAVLRALLGTRQPLSQRMAGQLLLPVAAGDRGHAPRTARTLRLAVGCGMPAAHPVMRLLLQQLSDSMTPPPPPLKSSTSRGGAAAPPPDDADGAPREGGRQQKGTEAGAPRHSGGRDASVIVQGAEGGYTWVPKRAGYQAKRRHLQLAREQYAQQGESLSRQHRHVAQLSPSQAALTACAVLRSGAHGEGTLDILDTLVAQAATPSVSSSKSSLGRFTRSLSRLLPFRASASATQPSKSDQELLAEIRAAKDARAMARLMLALARATQGAQRSEHFEQHKSRLVAALSSSPHLSSTDALRVALGLASWKGPVPSDPSQQAQRQQQQRAELGAWVLRAMEAHAEATVQPGALPSSAGNFQMGGYEEALREEKEKADSAVKADIEKGILRAGSEEARAKQEQLHREALAAVLHRATVEAMVREAERKKMAESKRAAAWVSELSVGHARVLASALGPEAQGSLPQHMLDALQERAGFV
ncbi:hypothetical protein DUNSADRAFT_1287 [Dunaliella salina]|uniref:Uncharacterized protein n=1 Tax=Dunaliella salina TaxID=3046 RepID=A0ABQ7GXB6_DUNSA|nr:hypothetical protein DUNSADRAFT_1287 [Dunaliella salina]|eukprot:KAF5839253.1 hypothetical protein DUNSADRAFT_1287 [Dunaliella salina]